MGLFNLLFGNSKKKQEEERLARERQLEQERLRKTEEARLAKERERRLAENQRKEAARQALLKAENESKKQTQNFTSQSASMNSSLQSLVNKCLELEAKGNISELQNNLFSLYKNFNQPGGGSLITSYKQKDNLALCFAFLLQYDWMHDSDLREVFAENGFYCIIEHIMHQSGGRQGQTEAMIILFTLLCAGRDSLRPKIQDILNKAKMVENPIFHKDDYTKGAQNIIDQISLMAVSGVRELGPAGAPIMSKICERYNGYELFQSTITRTDLMKYNPLDVFQKMTFIHNVIESILKDM